ncbi:uncharacterized protein JN550_009400 [Neoarthrinium moseri]|uniref:uncharacterized protein n=1 Tax=Neoarthrinium moseri TaxID=1658444 RepID=UPI001FDC302E|nr:uncharacterized protein JN550_009400 [Neoarthrinium moseri]KAI1863700.1 hypothetical protein JN550_009400 [Neoarthrinium moseri]
MSSYVEDGTRVAAANIAYALGNISDPHDDVPSGHEETRFRASESLDTREPDSPPRFSCEVPKCPSPDYHTKAGLNAHRQKRCHFWCDLCKTHFYDEDALFLHNGTVHKQPQQLVCPGCGDEFIRAGALMQHVEQRSCPLLPEMLHERRKKAVEFEEALKKKDSANADFVLAGKMKNLKMQNWYPAGAQPLEQRPGDLQSGNYPALGQELKDFRAGYSKQPDLLTGNVRVKPKIPPVREVENKWNTQENLFPGATSSISPTPSQLADCTKAAPSARDIDLHQRIDDPSEPGFNAAVFYVPLLERFKCPHAPRCNSKFKNAQGLIAHLQSPAHKPTVQFQCPHCQRIYNSMTAAMSHAEQASRICNIRETDEFRKFVNHVSGGMLDGLNAKTDCLKDGSPRFIVPKPFMQDLPFPTHMREKQMEREAKLGRGRMAEWDDKDDQEEPHKTPARGANNASQGW